LASELVWNCDLLCDFATFVVKGSYKVKKQLKKGR